MMKEFIRTVLCPVVLLRYARSPGQVIDTIDLDALRQIVEAIARQW